jgi:hypothetical protein
MYFYHGTTVENAVKILKERVLKGKKASKKHHNRYVSFSTNLLQSRQFGEVVFQFTKMDKAIPVQYGDEAWANTNKEISEYVLNNTVHDVTELENLNQVREEQEFVLVNKHDFQQEEVMIYLIGDDMKKLNQLKKQLDEVLGQNDTVKKSVKLYQDFLEQL